MSEVNLLMETNVMHYRKIWELHHNQTIPEGHEIHHLDGNRNNNDPLNLKCVSIQEHLEIHTLQNDWGAVQAILARMESVQDIKLISEAASKAQIARLEAGTHNWQIHEEKRKQRVKESLQKRILETGNAFIGIKDRAENSRKAGKIAAIKCAGFLDTTAEHHGSKAVKGTTWWTNKDGKHKRSINSPGAGWVLGMKYKEVNECQK